MSEHRGRIQSQGGKIEKSEPWNQADPILASDAKKKTKELEKRHTKKEKKLRMKAFRDAIFFIERARQNGGVSHPVSKTYMVLGDAHRRVDIEVKKGTAFVEGGKN